MTDVAERNKLIEAHYRKNFKPLVKLWTRRFGGHRANAEDLVQTGYTNALEGWPEGGPEDFDNWINTIINNAGKKEGKQAKERADMEVPLDESMVDERSPGRMIDASRVGQVRQWIREERPKTQLVLQAHFFKQWTFDEIAKRFGYSSRSGPSEVVRDFRERHNLAAE